MPKAKRYFIKKLETMPTDEVRKLQFKKTKETLERAYHTGDFYRNYIDRAKVKPEDFKKLEDIARSFFVEKQDLVKDQDANSPFGRRVSVPPSKFRRVNVTSGTSGRGGGVLP